MNDEKTNSLISISDLLGIGESTRELLRLIERGVGNLLEPWQKRRINRAEIDNARDWLALANEEESKNVGELSVTLGDRTNLRITHDQMRFQFNRETIAKQTIEHFLELPQSELMAAPAVLSDEWIDAYWSFAEKMSSEEMQSLWARIAVEKTAKGLDFPPRLLHFISLMDKDEIDAVTNIAPFVATQDKPHGGKEYFIVTNWSGLANDVSEKAKPYRKINEKISNIIGNQYRNILGPLGVFVETGWAYSILSHNKYERDTLQYTGYNFHITQSENICDVHKSGDSWTIGHGIQLSPFGYKVTRLCFKSEKTRAYLAKCSEILSMCGFESKIEELRS